MYYYGSGFPTSSNKAYMSALYCYDCTLVYEVPAEEDIRHTSAKWPRVWTEYADMVLVC